MATEQEILNILTGTKVFDGVQWRVYGDNGLELTQASPVLWRGVHGTLLMQAALHGIELKKLPAVSGVVEGMGFTKAAQLAAWSESVADMAAIHFEDQLATELLVALVTKGFFHGALHT